MQENDLFHSTTQMLVTEGLTNIAQAQLDGAFEVKSYRIYLAGNTITLLFLHLPLHTWSVC